MFVLKQAGKAIAHPFDFFYDLQFDRQVRYRDAVIIILLTAAVRVFSALQTGFSFSLVQPYQVSVPLEVFWIVVPWLSWSVSCWAVGAIVEGEGQFKHIVISSAYVYVPYIVIMTPFTLVSNVMTHKEIAFVATLNLLFLFWTLLLLVIHVKVLHDFELGKAIWVTLLALLGMLLMWFVCIMIFGLMNQTMQFFIDVFKEVGYIS